MFVRVKREDNELPEEWINLSLIENIEIDSDDMTIQFIANEGEYQYDFSDNEEDFLAIKNALMGIKPMYQKVNTNVEETLEENPIQQ